MDVLNEEDIEEMLSNNSKSAIEFWGRYEGYVKTILLDQHILPERMLPIIRDVMSQGSRYIDFDQESGKYVGDFFPSFGYLCRAIALYGEGPPHEKGKEKAWREILTNARGTIYEDEIEFLYDHDDDIQSIPNPQEFIENCKKKYWQVIINAGITTREHIDKQLEKLSVTV